MLFLRLRLQAWRLARSVRSSMRTNPQFWEPGTDRDGNTALVWGRFRVTLIPRRLRIFDSVHLFCDGAEVWLPLWTRSRLRNTARLLIVQFAQQEWDSPTPTRRRDYSEFECDERTTGARHFAEG